MFIKPKVHDVIKLEDSERGEIVDRYPLLQGKVILEGGSSFNATVARVKNIKEARESFKSFLLAPGRLSTRHNIGIYWVTSPVTAKTEEEWWIWLWQSTQKLPPQEEPYKHCCVSVQGDGWVPPWLKTIWTHGWGSRICLTETHLRWRISVYMETFWTSLIFCL